MDVSGKRILVTGATGFIGGRLAERLVTEEGVVVRGLVRTPEKGRRLADIGVELMPGDITDPVSVQSAMAGCQLVFHTAAWVSEHGSRAAVWAVNVEGTKNVVEAALAAGVKRFIHLSSCAVYGSLQQDNIDENTPPRVSGDLYGDSKIAAEEIVFNAYRKKGLPVVAARPSQVYGPGSYQFTVRPVELIKAGRMMLIDGGRYFCKPVYIDNVVDGLILCAKIDAAVGQAINLTDSPIPWRDFLGAYGRMLVIDSFPSIPFKLAWLLGFLNELGAAMSGRKASFNRRLVKALHSDNSFSNQKARKLLGWVPKVDLTEGMCRTEAWLRAEGYI
ncbi:MAG: NAD-dependent epimerase/dehydratase family protein [Anaerolineae bacterium]|nr:NAD-dependent epimerase/dehydratase family protein [Anaerolineae bacterium]